MCRCRFILTALLVLAPLAACATTGPAESSRAPGDLPIRAVLDSASLATALREAGPSAADLPAPSFFRIHFGADGTPDSIRPVFRRLPEPYAAAMAALIRPHVRVQPPRKKGWSYHVRAEPGPTPRIEVPVYEERVPEILNREEISEAISRYVASIRATNPAYPKGPRTAMLKMVVKENGVPEDVTLVRRSWDLQVDREAVRMAERLRFRPGALNGFPVDVVVTMPLTFEF